MSGEPRVGCQAEITTAYFEVNARPVCPGCRDGVVAATTGGVERAAA